MATLFISFKSEDTPKREGLEGSLRNTNTAVQYRHVSVSAREDRRPQGESAVKTYLRELMSDCHGVVLLLGPNAHTSPWVKYEMDVAQSRTLPIVAVSTTDNTNYTLPMGLPSSTVVHRWADRNVAIERMISRR